MKNNNHQIKRKFLSENKSSISQMIQLKNQGKISGSSKTKSEPTSQNDQFYYGDEECSQVNDVGFPLTRRNYPDSESDNYMVFKNVVIPRDMNVTTVSAYFWNLNPVQVLIYRQHGSSLSLVGRSETLTPTSQNGVNTFNLQTPLEAYRGDFVGVYYPKKGSIAFNLNKGSFTEKLGVGSILYTPRGKGPLEFIASSDRTYSIQVSGKTCYIPAYTVSQVNEVGFPLTRRDYPDSESDNYMVFKNVVIPRDMTVTTVNAYFWNLNPVQVLIYRQHGSSLSLVGRSETLTPYLENAVNTFHLHTPLEANRGDFVGVYYPQQGSIAFNLNKGSFTENLGVGSILYTPRGKGPLEFIASSDRTYSIQVSGLAKTLFGKCSQVNEVGFPLTRRAHPDSYSNNYLVFKNIVIPRDMNVTTVNAYFWNLNPVQVLIYRQHGSSLSLVGRSETLTPYLENAVNTFHLHTPLEANRGDFVGVYYPQQGSIGFDLNKGSYTENLGVGSTLYTNEGKGPLEFAGSSDRTYSIQVSGLNC